MSTHFFIPEGIQPCIFHPVIQKKNFAISLYIVVQCTQRIKISRFAQMEIKEKKSNIIDLVDESFDENKTSYHLSILAEGNEISSLILDTDTNKYVALNFSGEEFFKKVKYKSTSCCIANNKSTLIPSALFDEEKKESLLGFNHEIKP